jgi:EmrB/QacA subfamily drug resistance transporter
LDRRQRRVLAATLSANALIFFDQTAVTVALPEIQRQFHTTPAGEQWVITAYLLSMAVCMPAAGRFADHFGRKRMFLVGAAVFGFSSALCAAAPGLGALIAARFCQGIGASILQPIALGNTTRAVGDERRGWAIGMLSTGGTTFLALGPLIAGALLEVASWRWLFLINLPVVAYAVIQGWRFITPSREPESGPLNWAGLGLLLTGLAALVLGITQLDDWHAQAWLLVAGGSVLLAGFARHELVATRPLIDLRLLGDRQIRGALTALFAIQFVVMGTTVYLVLYLQHGLRISTLWTGVVLAVAGIFTPLLSTTTGRMADRRGPGNFIPLGLAIASVGLLWTGLASSWERVALLVPGLLVFSFSRPLVFTPASVTPLATLGPSRRGLASSLVTEARQLGSVLGVALLGALFASQAPARSFGDQAQITAGFRLVMLVAAGVAGLAGLWAWLLLARPVRGVVAT